MKTNYNKSRIMKMAHVRRNVDKMMFGCVKGDFAYYLRGAWASVKEEAVKGIEKLHIADACRDRQSDTPRSESFFQGCLGYYASAPRGSYFGD